ncbi:type-F conjugative transfer system pilin assembly protein TrbC [Novosphingobium sp. SL115]|uniref:type-F conjugative transfer system pilin assembly protein TrbC n=1 Tax=Novosphingobium sp. SL115 TaxID=2995150 RepID=UPI002275B933|nr:type-F conjugative transfer system pilin assembly protein TrbC [Novosphingobium sp. SL115]MCY1669609.1 type-F conjugative transfer system pilin assembly protein TrbC [Novosphingobium sp. SL115]
MAQAKLLRPVTRVAAKGAERKRRASGRTAASIAVRFAGLALLAGMSAAMGQSIEGLDLSAIRARSAASQDELEALVAAATKTAEEQATAAGQVGGRAQGQAVAASPLAAAEAQPGPVDFEAILDGAAANAAVPEGEGPLLIVFASLSMPQATLQRLVRDTTMAGGLIVFRGFPNNSARVFAKGLSGVIRDQREQAHIAIDPRLFRAFRVETAPTFVVADGAYELCDGLDCINALPPHERMVGNVTLAYALETFAETRGQGSAIARVALARLAKAQHP